MHDPTAGRDPEVDGISTTVQPRSTFRLPSTPGHGREPATPLSLHAVARRRAGLPVWDDFPCPDVLSRFAPTASDESLRGCRGRTHHELPARRARNVTTSSAPLMADPDLLEIHRRRRGGLARARHPWSARVKPRDTEASSPFTFDELPLHTPGSRSPSSSPRSRLHGRSASAQATLQGTHA